MINYQTIISLFNGKDTLMEWLKKVEEALKSDTLTNIYVSQPNNNKVIFTFAFKDGSTIVSPVIDLPQGPQGPQGPKGDTGGSVIVKENAEACTEIGDGYIDNNGHLQVLTQLSPKLFTDVGEIRGPQGPQGIQGPQGDNGISIIGANIIDNHLILILSNNTTLDAGEFDTYTKEQIDAKESNLRAVAEGKCKSFVINDLSDITGTNIEGNFENVTAIAGVDLIQLKIGDVILVKALNVADYWVSQITPSISLNKLETSKVDLINGIYPIGSIYMSVNNTNPSTLFGGTWEALNNGNELKIITKNDALVKAGTTISDPGTTALHFKASPGQLATGSYLTSVYGSGSLFELKLQEYKDTTEPGQKLIPDNLHAVLESINVYMWRRTA